MPLTEYAKTFDVEKAWEVATPAIHKLGAKLKENGGPYFLGKTGKFLHLSLFAPFLFILFRGGGRVQDGQKGKKRWYEEYG